MELASSRNSGLLKDSYQSEGTVRRNEEDTSWESPSVSLNCKNLDSSRNSRLIY